MAAKPRSVVVTPVVASNTVSTKTEGLTFSKTEKWGSDNDGNSNTTSIKCCKPLNTAYAKLLNQLVEAALREPQDEPFQSNRELFYNGRINVQNPPAPNVSDVCADLCLIGGATPNFVALAKAKFYNLTEPSRNPDLFNQRAQLEYQSYLLNLVAIARSAFLQIQEENCVRNVCCEALAKQIVAASLASNRLVRDAVLFSPGSYGLAFGTSPETGGDDATNLVTPSSPSTLRGLALLLQYNQLNTNLNAAFKIAGCTGFCPPDEFDPLDPLNTSNLPAQIPDIPRGVGTGYPYVPAPANPISGGFGPLLDPSLFTYLGENNCV